MKFGVDGLCKKLSSRPEFHETQLSEIYVLHKVVNEFLLVLPLLHDWFGCISM
jgi:hypothetical protein